MTMKTHAPQSASKTQIFLAVSLVFATSAAQATLGNYEDTHQFSASETVIQTGVQTNGEESAVIKGSTGQETLTFRYSDTDKVNAIVHTAQHHGVLTISNFSSVLFDSSNASMNLIAVANYWGINPIKFQDIDLLSFGKEDQSYKGDAVQALGGPIDIDVKNLYVNVTGNGLYLQQTNNNSSVTEGNLSVKAEDSLIVHADAGAVFIQSWSDSNTKDPTLSLDAKTIDLESNNRAAVLIQDYGKKRE